MRTKVNPDDINTRDLIGWEALQALHQTASDEDNRGHECESYTSETDGKESADVKELSDGKSEKGADGKSKKEADGKFKQMKSKLQAGE